MVDETTKLTWVLNDFVTSFLNSRAKLKEDGTPKLTEDGQYKLLEDET